MIYENHKHLMEVVLVTIVEETCCCLLVEYSLQIMKKKLFKQMRNKLQVIPAIEFLKGVQFDLFKSYLRLYEEI